MESAIDERTKMIAKDEKLKVLTFGLADHYGKLARILRESGEPDLAAQADRQAQELRQSMPKGRPGRQGPGKN